MKYLRKFETEAGVMIFDTPNVVLAADTGKVLYNVKPPKGVFIQHVNGSLFTTANWTAGGYSNDEANGVAIITDSKSFVVAKTGIHSNTTWSSDTTALEGVTLTTDISAAKKDYAGEENTKIINSTIHSNAAKKAVTYKFPCGVAGYLPSAGELNILYSYKSSFNAAVSIIGGVSLSSEYWSSTQVSGTMAWRMKDDKLMQSSKSTPSYVRPFMNLLLEM